MQSRVRPLARSVATLVVPLVLFVSATPHPAIARSAPTATPSSSALIAKVRTELAGFTHWLEANRVQGLIGEVGWPSEANAAGWNAVAQAWYADADAAGLWVTAWAAGEWWGTSYGLTVYQDRDGGGVDSLSTQAGVLEAHPSTNHHLRGVNVNGGEFGVDDNFSNANPGRYDEAYHYDGQATFDFLAARGVRLVRLPFRWERLQPTLNGDLDQEELARLRAVTERAQSAGLTVIIDMHNFGRYRTPTGEQTLGSPALRSAFADAWRRISMAFAASPGVAYGLMNEPHDLPGGAEAWELASQSAVSTIRSTGDKKLIVVGGYSWSSVRTWPSSHPRAWIADPAGKLRYEAHHYFDHDGSGTYAWDLVRQERVAAAPGFAG